MYTCKFKVYTQVHIATFSYLQVPKISYVYCKYTKQAMYTWNLFPFPLTIFYSRLFYVLIKCLRICCEYSEAEI